MSKKIVQVIVTVMLGFIFSSGVVIIEESQGAKSIANDNNNPHIGVVDGLDAVPPYPPPQPLPPPDAN